MKLAPFVVALSAAFTSASASPPDFAVIEVTLADGTLRYQPAEVGIFPTGKNTTSIITEPAAKLKVAAFYPPETETHRLCVALPENPSTDLIEAFNENWEVNADADGQPRRILVFNCIAFPPRNETATLRRQGSASFDFDAQVWKQ